MMPIIKKETFEAVTLDIQKEMNRGAMLKDMARITQGNEFFANIMAASVIDCLKGLQEKHQFNQECLDELRQFLLTTILLVYQTIKAQIEVDELEKS
jgi:hypothetical protein